MEDLEEWRDIPGLEGRYQASTWGRIRSYQSKTGKGKIRKLPFDRGYYRFGWYNRGTRKVISELVHVTVLKTFVGERPEGAVIRHLDGDGLNNVLSNLVYGTQSENIKDCVEHGRHHEANKTHCPSGHEYTEENTMRSKEGWRSCRTCDRESCRRYRMSRSV